MQRSIHFHNKGYMYGTSGGGCFAFNSSDEYSGMYQTLTVIHTYAIMRLYENVDILYDLRKEFAGLIKSQNDMEIAFEPSSNIVCFRFVPDNGDINNINKKIAEELLKDGKQQKSNNKEPLFFKTIL